MSTARSNLKSKPRVVITNDDGPPTDMKGHSPFVYPFAKALVEQLGWDVKVVVPASQRSWVGKSYAITQTTTGQYYYPKGEHGTEGEKSDLPRPLQQGETMEWVLLDGTPATCANIAIHSLYPPESIDLVISGPNYGRNTSTAFALSSGTIGAAMAASLSAIPAIALSWGLMEGHKPPPQSFLDGAAIASCRIVEKLWQVGWGHDDTSHEERVDVYSINVPLMPSIIEAGGPTVYWTEMAKTNYQRLFKSIAKKPENSSAVKTEDRGGPAALPAPNQDEGADKVDELTEDLESVRMLDGHYEAPLKFVFSPDIGPLINPKPSSLREGTDNHALMNGGVSVTPIRAAFAAAQYPKHHSLELDGLKWRL